MSMPAELFSTELTLQSLLDGIVDAPAIPISSIATDSRELGDGSLFLACAGGTTHGVEFADKAINAGVAAIVYDSATADAPTLETSIPLIAVPGLQSHVGSIADRWFAEPSASVSVTGVTGTNGKTTVAILLAQSQHLLDKRCGYVGTLGHGVDEIDPGLGLTTPACVDLHNILADFRTQGATHAAIEVSSHALDQGRTDGVRFDTAMFTNLSRDHVDYHGDMKNYFEAKARLFLQHTPRHRLINIDDEFGQELADRCGADACVVSTRFDRVSTGRPFVFVRAVVADQSGSKVSVDTAWGSSEFTLALPGDFNVENAALVMAHLLTQGESLDDVCTVLSEVRAPRGRMQRVDVGSGDSRPAVYVDFAHTPAGLEAALRALRSHCSGKLWCVFGCGGDRDRGKRPQMGKAASKLADLAIVTSDNPRNEDPVSIISDVLSGMPDDALGIEDRGAAIAYAIAKAAPEDTVLIAGKGHEVTQIMGSRSIPFSDYGCAHANLVSRNKGGGES